MYPFRKLTAYILTLFAAAIGICSVFTEYSSRFAVSMGGKFIIACFFVAASALAALAHCLACRDSARRRHYLRAFTLALFIYYLLILLDLLFFDASLCRTGEELAELYNIIPLHTVSRFLRGYQLGIVSAQALLVNIAGNFCAFMPMAFFLPLFWRRTQRTGGFLACLFSIVAGAELLQMLTGTGTADIDDLLLNCSGALLIYGILRLFRNQKNR